MITIIRPSKIKKYIIKLKVKQNVKVETVLHSFNWVQQRRWVSNDKY